MWLKHQPGSKTFYPRVSRVYCLSLILLANVLGIFCDLFAPRLGLNASFDPGDIDQLVEEDIAHVSLSYHLLSTNPIFLRVEPADPNIAEVQNPKVFTLTPTNDSSSNNSLEVIKVKGVFLGRTKLTFSTANTTAENASVSRDAGGAKIVIDDTSGGGVAHDGWTALPYTYDVTVIREDGPLNTAFLVSIIVLVVLANVAMGCKVEIAVVKEILRRPLAPVVGLLSQFIIMPLLGLAASQAFRFDPGTALGLFATGCAPGGGASNAYSFLLDGDVSLSVTMTLISTLASFAFIPLWLFTIGTRVLYKDQGVRIPFENIFTSLIGLILPVLIGLLIRWKRPHWVKTILRAVTPLMILTLIVILSVGIYANLYIFKLLRPEVLLAGAILPNCGFILGGVAALVFRQPWKRVKTIAIETGLQNTGIPIVLLQVSLPKPDSDFAIVAPIASAIFTPILLWIWFLVRFIRKKCFHKPNKPPKLSTDDVDMCDHEVEGEATLSQTPTHSPERSYGAHCPDKSDP